MPTSPRLAASRILRMRSMSGRSAKRIAIAVPPEKSMPNLRPFWTKTANIPTRISAQDAPIAHHLYFRKSMLVCRKSSIFFSFAFGSCLDRDGVDVLAAPVLELEDRVRHEDRREHGDEETDDQRHREALHRAGAELK